MSLRHLGTSWLSCYAFIDITVKQELYATPDPRRNYGFSGMITVSRSLHLIVLTLKTSLRTGTGTLCSSGGQRGLQTPL